MDLFYDYGDCITSEISDGTVVGINTLLKGEILPICRLGNIRFHVKTQVSW